MTAPNRAIIGEKSGRDNVADAMLPELQIEIGIGKRALTPVPG